MIALYPTAEQIENLLAAPDDSPVVMINLLRFKERATEPDEGLSGEEAYSRYAEEMRKIVESHGGRFLWMGRVDSMVIGNTEERFDMCGLVEYPSRKAFLEVTQDLRVQEIGVHRTAGLEGQWLIAATPARSL